jgi:hypothetical protein
LIAIPAGLVPRETVVSSYPGGMDVDIEIRRRGGMYTLIAHRFGAVVRAKELRSGIEELERRIAMIDDDYRGAGIPIPAEPVVATKQMGVVDRVTPTLIVVVTVAVVIAAFIFFATAPLVNVIASFRNEIAGLRTELTGVRAEITSVRTALTTVVGGDGKAGVAELGRRGADVVIAASQMMEQITPERKEELRLAIRKIARELDIIIQDVKSPSPPQLHPNGEHR